ncbi:hypothetical protein GGR56DRAFT_64880 [Xylariaceae sp. FL0804]|nr:hypothetical protein GGR56DRAFT_64880 [Xylariaceae sp. FL0804]
MEAFYPLAPDPARGEEIEVICAGLPRCGTNSLKHALQYLGYPTCHMMDILWWPDRQRQAIALYREPDRHRRQAMLRELFRGFRANCDAPGPSFADDLMDLYPDARIVLNQRADAALWARSFAQGVLFFAGWQYWLAGLLLTLDRLHCQFTALYVRQLQRRFGLLPRPSIFRLSSWLLSRSRAVQQRGRRRYRMGKETKNDDHHYDAGEDDGDADEIWLRDAYTAHNAWVRAEAARRGRNGELVPESISPPIGFLGFFLYTSASETRGLFRASDFQSTAVSSLIGYKAD